METFFYIKLYMIYVEVVSRIEIHVSCFDFEKSAQFIDTSVICMFCYKCQNLFITGLKYTKAMCIPSVVWKKTI